MRRSLPVFPFWRLLSLFPFKHQDLLRSQGITALPE
jgi:hypothetical protein